MLRKNFYLKTLDIESPAPRFQTQILQVTLILLLWNAWDYCKSISIFWASFCIPAYKVSRALETQQQTVIYHKAKKSTQNVILKLLLKKSNKAFFLNFLFSRFCFCFFYPPPLLSNIFRSKKDEKSNRKDSNLIKVKFIKVWRDIFVRQKSGEYYKQKIHFFNFFL